MLDLGAWNDFTIHVNCRSADAPGTLPRYDVFMNGAPLVSPASKLARAARRCGEAFDRLVRTTSAVTASAERGVRRLVRTTLAKRAAGARSVPQDETGVTRRRGRSSGFGNPRSVSQGERGDGTTLSSDERKLESPLPEAVPVATKSDSQGPREEPRFRFVSNSRSWRLQRAEIHCFHQIAIDIGHILYFDEHRESSGDT